MFKLKSQAELAKMTQEELDQYAIDKANHEASQRREELENLRKDLEEKMKNNSATPDQLKAFNTQMEELKEMVNQVRDEKKSGPVNENFFSLVEKGLKDNLASLKAFRDGSRQGDQELTIEIKAAIPVLNTAFANASGVTTPDAIVYQSVNAYAADVRPDAYIINFLTNGTTDKASLPYMDKVPNEGAAAVTAQGALKPLISFTFELRYSSAQKVAGRIKVSEEALDDVSFLMSLIQTELKYEHDIAEQNMIFTKINAIAAAFVAGDMAASTDLPSNYDAIRAAAYMIKIVSKGQFIPNAVLVPSADVYSMGATKTTYGQYVLPPFVLPDGTRILNMTVVEVNDDTVEAGSFVVGDFRRIKRNVYKGFTIRIGQGIQGSSTAANIVSDFESNMYTVIGESRLHVWCYKNDEKAFVKATFAEVKEAIDSAP